MEAQEKLESARRIVEGSIMQELSAPSYDNGKSQESLPEGQGN